MPSQQGLDDLPQVILTLVLVFCILAVGTFVVNSASQTGPADTKKVSAAPLLDGSNWVTIDDDVGKNEVVYNSLGWGMNFTGANDSYAETTDEFEVSNDRTWTVSVWAYVDADAKNETMTAVVTRNIKIAYNGTSGKWVGWFYDSGSRDSWKVTINATDQPGNLSNVQLVANGSHMTIYRNLTQGGTVAISGESTAETPLSTQHWDGRIDEIRAIDDGLSASQRNQLYNSPNDGLPDVNHSGRIMFDERDRAQQRLFWAPGDVITSNASFVRALPGEELEGKGIWNDLTGATDYRWDIVGPKIKAVDGGQLDGSPVAYVTYEAQSSLNTLADDWNKAMGLGAVLIVILPLGAILSYLYASRGRR